MNQQFLEDTAGTFTVQIYTDNRKSVPSSATITVYKPGSTEELVATTAMTVAGDGLLSYSLTTANNDIADENYRAVVEYVLSGDTKTVTVFYDVVKSILHKVVIDDDVLAELPQLKDNGYRVHGTSTAGSTTTLTDLMLQRYADDYFTGGMAISLTQDETREITDFVSSTGVVTTTAFPASVATDKYVLVRSYKREIDRAFEKLIDLIKRQGKRAHLILDSNELREVHLMFAVSEACKSFVTATDGGLWWELWQHYDKRAYSMFKSIEFKYDESRDGVIGSGEEGQRMNRTIGRA